MESEVFLKQEDVIPLTKALTIVLRQNNTASDRQTLLENAGIKSALIGNLRLESQPNILAPALVAEFRRYRVDSRWLDYHPMVSFLEHLCDFAEDYPLSQQDVTLFRRLVEQGQNNLQAFKERSTNAKIESFQVTQKITKNPTKILFLAADPSDASRLRLGQELRDIKERLQLSSQRDAFILEARTSVRPGDISQALLDFKPNIVHFSGHGNQTGELLFENALGEIKPVAPQALSQLFKLVSDQVNCVVLNACYSDLQAQAIAEHISFVIGMNKAIGDQAAITFAVGFYKALCAGEPTERAFQFGCVELQLESIPEELTPVLRQKN
ncbi:hypothetical protein NIES4103_45240 [Nostoc sp. NIES-4103]|nr:hypothetical protein NIES4103_45240 [Nostoc sp. NIES-4103]